MVAKGWWPHGTALSPGRQVVLLGVNCCGATFGYADLFQLPTSRDVRGLATLSS